jgi:predicted nucleic acid-binding protein
MKGDVVVVDASVAIAHLMDEAEAPYVSEALMAWARAGVVLLVPSHFWIEITNVLVRRHAQPAGEVVEDLVNLDDLGIRTADLDRPMLLLAIDYMARLGLSAYDSIYLALAVSTGASLATLDTRLAAAAGEHGLLLARGGPKRLAEGTVPYGTPTPAAPWAQSAVAGAHIARLRRQLSG